MTNDSTVAVVEPRWQWRSFWWGVAGGLVGSMLIDAVFGGTRHRSRAEEHDEDVEDEQGEGDTE